MATLTEDHCSKEIYRLLIEKGFDREVHTTFDEEGYTQPSITLQMAMKWLREVHHIGIFPTTYYRLTAEHEGHDYGCTLINLNTFELIGTFENCTFSANTYEETCEVAIKYCLENLI